MQLGQLRRGLRITVGETNQLLQVFDYWPTPPDETTLPLPCAATIWFCDFLAVLGVLEQSARLEMAKALRPLFEPFGDDIIEASHYEKATVRIADRRYLGLADGHFLDLLTGADLPRLPIRPVEKAVYDVGSLVIHKRRDHRG